MGRRTEPTLFQNGNAYDQQAHEKMSTSLIIREMLIKTTVRCHLIPGRMSAIKKNTIAHVCKDVEKTEPLYTVGGNVNLCSQWETVWSFLKTLKLEQLYDSAMPLLGIHPEQPQTPHLKRYMHPSVQSSIIYSCRVWKQPVYDLCDPMDCRPPCSSSSPGSSAHWIILARMLEQVAISSSWGIFPIQESNSHPLRLLH